jgi:hypothetical protein
MLPTTLKGEPKAAKLLLGWMMIGLSSHKPNQNRLAITAFAVSGKETVFGKMNWPELAITFQ